MDDDERVNPLIAIMVFIVIFLTVIVVLIMVRNTFIQTAPPDLEEDPVEVIIDSLR